MKIKDLFRLAIIITVFITIPQSRGAILSVLIFLWEVIREFFLKDLFTEKIIYYMLLLLVSIMGFILTRKQKGKLKYIVIGAINIIGLLKL